MVERILRITQNTFLKRRLAQSSELSADEIYSIPAGTVLKIQSYAYANAEGDFQNHIKFALEDTALSGFNTWFVYTPHAQVEFDGEVVYPLTQILRITHDTFLKRRPAQASELETNELYKVSAGQTWAISSYAYANADGDFKGHIKFALQQDEIQGFNTWFVYTPHAQVELGEEIVYPLEDQATVNILKVTRDTVFKHRPLQSSILSAWEVHQVPNNSSFKLHSYATADNQGDFDSHIKITLRDEADYIEGRNTWFVYDKHGHIEFDDKVIYPPPQASPFMLRITRDTMFKRRPLQSSGLSADEIHSVGKGSRFKLHSYAHDNTQGTFSGHIKFALGDPSDYIWDLSTWFVYAQHAQVEKDGKVVYPPPAVPPPPPKPKSFKLPGNVSTFYVDQPIIAGGSFTWGEATHGGQRIPRTTGEVSNILALAKQLQRARNQIGRPFNITSWYRPEPYNTRAGGVRNSQHLGGKAVDLWVDGYSGRRLANALMLWWPGGVGIYAHLPDIIHLDIGGRRTWGF
ncbi:MAG: DUF882 domain-containing protein [Cyanothece sp. SIO1E1]|nr:DUF882 domain-containing protein [Cyanothece sp. SIO1E1]